jgi:hypothetical protein
MYFAKQISVGATTALLTLAASKERTQYDMSAATAFYISPDPAFSATQGFLIPANTIYHVDASQGHDPRQAVYCLSTVGTIAVTVRHDDNHNVED